MKNLVITFGIFAIILMGFNSSSIAQTSGGPDSFGYIWTSSADATGPEYNWIDISADGTLVEGLADDNSVGFIPLGFNFTYYENTYYSVKIGSNGWISFNDVANLSLCFPPIPTSGGGGDNIMCIFTADLIHIAYTGANPAKVYYKLTEPNKFVISFHDIPYWVNTSTGFSGSNTFQIIIDGNTNTFTYQYLSLEPTVLNALEACTMNTSVGFENSNGSIGLQITSNHNLPSNESAYKIECPGCWSAKNTLNLESPFLITNPVNEEINLGFSAEKIEIYSNNKLVLNFLNKSCIDVSSLKSGLYFLRIIDDEQIRTSRFIKI
jgi:hypothetical protein